MGQFTITESIKRNIDRMDSKAVKTARLDLALGGSAFTLKAEEATSYFRYSNEVIRDGATSYYRLGESSGSVAVDRVGSNDGAYNAPFTLGEAGILYLDDDTSVELVGGGTVTANTPQLLSGSVECIFYLEPGASIILYDALAYPAISWAFAGGFFTYVSGGVGDLDTTSVTDVSMEGWHHYVMTTTGSAAKMYIDGVQVGNTTASATLGVDWTLSPEGKADEFALYDGIVLTDAQVLRHYQAFAGIQA